MDAALYRFRTRLFPWPSGSGDGSLVRVRITPVSDARKIYWQKVSNPGPGSDYSQWTYTGQYDSAGDRAASNGPEVSIVWIKNTKELKRLKSTDYGSTWGSPETIDTLQTTSIYGVAAAYKPNGDLAVFFADNTTIYIKKYIGGQWQSKVAWDKSTGALSGVSCIYDGDWNLLVTGKDAAGNFKVWGLVYGDGSRVASGTWSALKEVASAPAGGDFSYKQPFLDKTDACRCFSWSHLPAWNPITGRFNLTLFPVRILMKAYGGSRRRLIFLRNMAWRWRIMGTADGCHHLAVSGG